MADGDDRQTAEPPPQPVWCVVANVVEEHRHGEGADMRRGTKHFQPGAKVYCREFHWQGERQSKVQVVGRHRKSHRYITIYLPIKWLTNWRADLVYSPHVIRQLAGLWDGSSEGKERAEGIVAELTGGKMPWGVAEAWTERQWQEQGKTPPTLGIYRIVRWLLRRFRRSSSGR